MPHSYGYTQLCPILKIGKYVLFVVVTRHREWCSRFQLTCSRDIYNWYFRTRRAVFDRDIRFIEIYRQCLLNMLMKSEFSPFNIRVCILEIWRLILFLRLLHFVLTFHWLKLRLSFVARCVGLCAFTQCCAVRRPMCLYAVLAVPRIHSRVHNCMLFWIRDMSVVSGFILCNSDES